MNIKRNMIRRCFKPLSILFLSLVIVVSMFSGLLNYIRPVQAEGNVTTITSKDKNIQVTQFGCELNIKTTQETDWKVPRKPIDLVILQDASGSFEKTIGGVKEALKKLTSPVAENEYDSEHPKLVFTNDPKTSDRVMVSSFQGLDGFDVYDNANTTNYTYNGYQYTLTEYTADSNFKENKQSSNWANNAGYRVHSSDLVSDTSKITDFIDKISTDGGTPTVPAIKKVIEEYKKKVESSEGKMENERIPTTPPKEETFLPKTGIQTVEFGTLVLSLMIFTIFLVRRNKAK